MIGSDDRARIVDFGLARPSDASTLTTTGTVLGTIAYLSPEQSYGYRLDHRSDIFSFGIVLYEALTGMHPFTRIDSVETVRRIRLESPNRIKGPLGKVVARCLKKKPEDRYQDTTDLVRDLEEQLAPTLDANSATQKTSPTESDPEAPTVKIGSAAQRREAVTRPRSLLRRHWPLIALLTTLLIAFVAYESGSLPRADRELAAAVREAPPGEESELIRTTVSSKDKAKSPPTATQVSQATLLPACGLTGSPGIVDLGASAQLRWSSTNAVRVVISPDIGIVGPNGSIDVFPRATTTYHIAATSADGVVAQGSLTIKVAKAPPGFIPLSGSFAASPDTIRRGEFTTLQWNSFNATRAVITPDIGVVPLTGSIDVSPRATTRYTMALTNDFGGSGDATAVVRVETLDSNLAPKAATPAGDLTCVAATQAGITGTVVTDSSSCSVPAGRTVTRATLDYTLDDGGDITVNGRKVFSKMTGTGPHKGTVNLPTDMFVPGDSFLLRVDARNTTNSPGKIYGKAIVRLVTSEPMATKAKPSS